LKAWDGPAEGTENTLILSCGYTLYLLDQIYIKGEPSIRKHIVTVTIKKELCKGFHHKCYYPRHLETYFLCKVFYK